MMSYRIEERERGVKGFVSDRKRAGADECAMDAKGHCVYPGGHEG
jgi:hypothetical protein